MATLIRKKLHLLNYWVALFLLLLVLIVQYPHFGQAFSNRSVKTRRLVQGSSVDIKLKFADQPFQDKKDDNDSRNVIATNNKKNGADGNNTAIQNFRGPITGYTHPVEQLAVRRQPIQTVPFANNSNNLTKGNAIRKSAYVCEDGALRLSCSANKYIDVLRANFGRFSITLCNPSGFLDWSVNCASSNSLPVLTQRCSGRNECSIAASSYIFGDPCPTTAKYLEVHYTCSSERQIDSNRNSTSMADNDYALQTVGGDSKAPGVRPISQENSLFGQVLTSTQSSMNGVLSTQDMLAHKTNLNQDLLPSTPPPLLPSNYLNSKCNQPDSEKNRKPNSDAECKQTEHFVTNENYASERVSSMEQQQHRANLRERDSLESRSPVTMSNFAKRLPSEQKQPRKQYQLQQNQQNENKNVNKHQTENDFEKSTAMLKVSPAVRPKIAKLDSSFYSSCPALIFRNINWPSTAAGSVIVQPCPRETSGFAQWRCNGSQNSFAKTKTEMVDDGVYTNQAHWNGLPDLSRCYSRWLLELHSFQNVNNFRNDIWKSTLTSLERSTTIYGADLVKLNSLLYASLQSIIEKQNTETTLYNSPVVFPSRSGINFETIFETTSFLLSGQIAPKAAWFDLPISMREITAFNLLDVVAKYTTQYCANTDLAKLLKIFQWNHLALSCHSTTQIAAKLQTATQTVSSLNEFKFNLLNLPSNQEILSFNGGDVTVSVVVDLNHFNINAKHFFLENNYFGTIVTDNVHHYFEINGNQSIELNFNKSQQQLIGKAQWEKTWPFLNSNVIKLIFFNVSQLVLGEYSGEVTTNEFTFEFTFKHHSIKTINMLHQCVHWEIERRRWSTEQCTLLYTNQTHSICRCNLVSVFSLLATKPHSTNNETDIIIQASTFPRQRKLQEQQQYWRAIWPIALMSYMWLVLSFMRCRENFFNRFNFVLLLSCCAARAFIELVLVITVSLEWLESWPTIWCLATLALLLVAMQTIVSLLVIFVFQNFILLLLARKIYLGKNYVNCAFGLAKSKQIQISTLFAFAFLQFTLHILIFVNRSSRNVCSIDLVYDIALSPLAKGNIFMIFAPILQILIIIFVGICFLHCSQKLFSDYGYPDLHHKNVQTELLEKHIKKLSSDRCKHSILWIIATLVYLATTVIPLCTDLAALNEINPSVSRIGLDAALLFTFFIPLLPRVNRAFSMPLLKKWRNDHGHCGPYRHQNQAKSKHCSIKVQTTSSAPTLFTCSSTENSISILSDSSKSFFTLPNVVGSKSFSAKMMTTLNAPKVYPSPSHQSSLSSTMVDASKLSNQSILHVYQSPKDIFPYEYERYLLQSNAVFSTPTAFELPESNNIYALRPNSHFTHLPLETNNPSRFEAVASTNGMYHFRDLRQSIIHGAGRPKVSAHKANCPLQTSGPSHLYRPPIYERDNLVIPN